MEQENVQAVFQLQDSYVKEFNIHILNEIDRKKDLNIIGEVSFKINNITEDNNNYVGQIELINSIKVKYKEKECADIYIAMVGLFTGNKVEKYDIKHFEEMLKLNGATTLSHLIRAYIYSVTGLSGIPQITTPMINFVEFFKNAKEIKNNNM